LVPLFTLRVCVKDFSQNLYNTHPARVIIFFCNFPHLSIAILGLCPKNRD